LAFHSPRRWQHARGQRLEFWRWQHARELRPELTSIRPALATRSGASPRIGVYSSGVSNMLGGYSNNGFCRPGKSEPLLHLIVGFRSQVIFDSGPAVPQLRFGSGFSPLNPILYSRIHSKCPNSGGNKPIRMLYVKYEGKSTVCNTRWPGIHIKRALSRNFLYLRYEVCTDGRIGCLTMNWASTW
jgi:hypothetical protein